MSIRILTAVVTTETDVVAARQRAKQIAQLCGFGLQDQVRIATAEEFLNAFCVDQCISRGSWRRRWIAGVDR